MDFDPIQAAEDLLSEKSEAAQKLGLGLILANNIVKRKLQQEAGDTVFSNELDSYLAVAARLGFKVVLVENFSEEDTYGTSQFGEFIRIPYTRESQYYVLWNEDDGVLLAFDTYPRYEAVSKTEVVLTGSSVNGGNFYYNWIPNDIKTYYNNTSSGSFHKPKGMTWDEFDALPASEKVYVGSHDCRESLAYKYGKLKENGTFLKKWKERPFYSILHYMEWKMIKEGDLDTSNAATEARISRLPAEVQEMIGPKH